MEQPVLKILILFLLITYVTSYSQVSKEDHTFGNFTLQEVMNYISWIGLEGTQNYIDTIQNNPLELSRKVYIENAARIFYSHN